MADVIGQEHVTRTLQHAIESGRVAHAYLFVGPRGIGKTTLSRIFAKALNCEHGPTPTPCDECDLCREIMAGNAWTAGMFRQYAPGHPEGCIVGNRSELDRLGP